MGLHGCPLWLQLYDSCIGVITYFTNHGPRSKCMLCTCKTCLILHHVLSSKLIFKLNWKL